MNQKRDKLKVIYDILVLINRHHNSIKPTPLMRSANLSTSNFNIYLNELKSKELVKELEDKGSIYITLTDKGFTYLEKYKQITSFIEEFNL